MPHQNYAGAFRPITQASQPETREPAKTKYICECPKCHRKSNIRILDRQHYYCTGCELEFTLNEVRCPECGQKDDTKLRTEDGIKSYYCKKCRVEWNGSWVIRWGMRREKTSRKKPGPKVGANKFTPGARAAMGIY